MRHFIGGGKSTVTIKEVATLANTSPATVSRVLNGFASVNPDIARRVHEAVRQLNYQSNMAGRNLRMGMDLEFGPDFRLRSRQHEDVKRLIGQRAAELVRHSDMVVLDSGSTVSCMVPYLSEGVLLYTYSLAILQSASKRQLSVHLAPGLYVPSLAAVFGADTESYFAARRATKYFLSSAHIDVRTGLFNTDPATCSIKQVILDRADMSILLVDHSKFCDANLQTFAPLSEVSLIITDYVPQPFRVPLVDTGIRFIETCPIQPDDGRDLM